MEPRDFSEVLAALLAPPARSSAVETLEEFRAAQSVRAAGFSPWDGALLAALEADRVAWLFAAGYQAALRRLVPELPASLLVSLAATEERGAHPKALQSTLRADGDGLRLDGSKRWCTLGSQSSLLLVVARDEREAVVDGRPTLRVARVPTDAPGVRATPWPDFGMVPELPHASLEFTAVRVREEDLLPGDGYAEYLKPFRTVEDVGVFGVVLAWWLVLCKRYAASPELSSRVLRSLCALRTVGALDARSPATHLALDALLLEARSLEEALEPLFHALPAAEAERWKRDRALLQVAQKARVARAQKAREELP